MMLVLVSVLTGGKIHFHVRIGALILIGLSIFTKKDKIIYRVYIKYCVFSKILKYSGLLPFFVFLRCHCVHTHQAGRTPAAELAKFRKITKF